MKWYNWHLKLSLFLLNWTCITKLLIYEGLIGQKCAPGHSLSQKHKTAENLDSYERNFLFLFFWDQYFYSWTKICRFCSPSKLTFFLTLTQKFEVFPHPHFFMLQRYYFWDKTLIVLAISYWKIIKIEWIIFKFSVMALRWCAKALIMVDNFWGSP